MPDTTVVETDLTCVTCGYNLRMLAWDGTCPECNSAVERSRIPDHLSVNDLRPMRMLRWGLALAIFGLLMEMAHASSYLIDLLYYTSITLMDAWQQYFDHFIIIVWTMAVFVSIKAARRVGVRTRLIALMVVAFALRHPFYLAYYWFDLEVFHFFATRVLAWDGYNGFIHGIALLDRLGRPLMPLAAFYVVRHVISESSSPPVKGLPANGIHICGAVFVLNALIQVESFLGGVDIIENRNAPIIFVWVNDILNVVVAILLFQLRRQLPRT